MCLAKNMFLLAPCFICVAMLLDRTNYLKTELVGLEID